MPKSTNDRDANARLAIAGLSLELGQDPGDGKAELVSVLMFEVGGAPYAIGVEHTEGVVDCPRITPLPNPPDGVAGKLSTCSRVSSFRQVVWRPAISAGRKLARPRVRRSP